MARSYSVYDVFTEERLAGNPLAVVFDGDGLSEEAMQAISREMNSSETCSSASHPIRRIAPPFAFSRRDASCRSPATPRSVLRSRLPSGRTLTTAAISIWFRCSTKGWRPVRCAVRLRQEQASFAEFDLPRKSQRIALPLDTGRHRQGARPEDQRDRLRENHVPSIWSAGVPFLLVPVHDVGVAERLDFESPAMGEDRALRGRRARLRLHLLPRAREPYGEVPCPDVPGRDGHCRGPGDGFGRGRTFRRHPPVRPAAGWSSSRHRRAGRGDGPPILHPSCISTSKAATSSNARIGGQAVRVATRNS